MFSKVFYWILRGNGARNPKKRRASRAESFISCGVSRFSLIMASRNPGKPARFARRHVGIPENYHDSSVCRAAQAKISKELP